MAKTTQCMKLNVMGAAYVCTFTPSRSNAFQLYQTWYDRGEHRKKIAEYANFQSVLWHLNYLNVPEFRMDSFKGIA